MRKGVKIFLIIVVVLVGIRLVLPSIIKHYANGVLNDLEGYRGHIEDVDLHLYRGAYTIDSVVIEKLYKEEPIPFVEIGKLDLSIEWKAILKGSLVGELIFHHPKLNIVDDNQAKKEDPSDTTTWLTAVKKLMPLKVNRLEVLNGEISFYNFVSQPKVDIKLNNLNLLATNISNVEDDSSPLPSTVKLTGNSIGNGRIKLDMKMNLLKEVPALDADFSFENVNMVDLNDFFKAYGNFDVEKGSFSLFTEMVIDDGKLDGYIKPIFEGVIVMNVKKDVKEKNLLQGLWEGIIGLFSEGLENQPKNQLATRIPIKGDLNQPDTPVWPVITNIFRNAFIEAFSKQVDGDVEFKI